MVTISATSVRPEISTKEIDLEDAIKLYGKPQEIDFNEAWAECSTAEILKRDSGVVSLVIDDEMFDNFKAYEDPEFRKEFNIPEWQGADPPSEDYQWMTVGCLHGALNYYKFPNPIPRTVKIIGINFALFE